jgi:hypothetical protein
LVTVSVTTNVFCDVNACVTERPAAAGVPSPKFQEYDVICDAPVPGWLVEASKMTGEFMTALSGDITNAAVGDPAGGRITPGGMRRMATWAKFAASKLPTGSLLPHFTFELGVATMSTVVPDPPMDDGGGGAAV